MKTSLVTGAIASGLPKREAAIWDALSSATTPLHISQISRAVRLHRPAIYEGIKRLEEKYLIRSVLLGKRLHYKTTGPKALATWKQSQDSAFSQYVATQTRRATQQGIVTTDDDIRIFRGKDLMKAWKLIVDEVERGQTFYRYDGYPASILVDGYMPPGYRQALERKRLDRFVITNEALRKREYKKRVECASRMLPAKIQPFDQGVTQFIFNDTLIFVDLVNEVAFIIKNKLLAEYHRQLFRFIYQVLPE